jgi:hypothetical protein
MHMKIAAYPFGVSDADAKKAFEIYQDGLAQNLWERIKTKMGNGCAGQWRWMGF